MPGSILGIVSLVAGAIGSGVTYASAQSAAKTSEQIAAANATTQLQSIDQQRQLSQMQAAINAELARKDQEAANANAAALESTADANSAASRESVRFSRLQAAKMAASSRAAMAKSGLDMSTGSTLALLAANEMESQNAANNIVYENEGSARALFREAASQRVQGQLAGINVTGQQAAGVAAAQKATQEAAQAKLDLYERRAAANAARTGAGAALFNTLGGLAGQGYTMFGNKSLPKKAIPKVY